jgi:ankyrin repeat protein
LHVAATVAIAEFLLEHGAEIDALDVDHESTPAQYLVRARPDVARFLVARGARTDILLAAALGDLERVRGFLDADPGCVRTAVTPAYFPKRDFRAGGCIYIWTLGQGKTAHVVAREFGHEDVFALLMERSPDALKLALACEFGDDAAVAAQLAAQPGLARSLGEDELRMLPSAAQNQNVHAVRLMLAAGWPPDATGQHGATALHWAGFHGNAVMAREILKHGPALEFKETDYGGTAVGWTIHGSLKGWHPERGDYGAVMEMLLDAGAVAPAPGVKVEASEAVLGVLRRRGWS